jgi:hypothetical protein
MRYMFSRLPAVVVCIGCSRQLLHRPAKLENLLPNLARLPEL